MKKFIIITILATLPLISMAQERGPFHPIQQRGSGSQSGAEGQLCPPGNAECLPNPLGPGITSIGDLLDRIIGALLIVSIPIATIMILVGAFQILTAAGDTEKFARGKKTILYSVVGLAIILLARVITAVIKSVLGG